MVSVVVPGTMLVHATEEESRVMFYIGLFVGFLLWPYVVEGVDRGQYWRSNGHTGWMLAVSVVFWPLLAGVQYLKYKALL